MKISIEFKTKHNSSDKITQSQNIIFQNVTGKVEQGINKFAVLLEGEQEEIINVFRNIWELAFLYDGYFYAPYQYTVDGIDENVEELYFLSYYRTANIWRNSASTLVGADKDFSEERIAQYSEFRNQGRTSGKMLKSLINSFFLHTFRCI